MGENPVHVPLYLPQFCRGLSGKEPGILRKNILPLKYLHSPHVNRSIFIVKKTMQSYLYTERRSRNYCCGGKRIIVTCSECVSVALVIQNTKCMHRIILSFVAFPAVPISLLYRIKEMIFRKVLPNKKMCVLIFSTTFV